MSREDNEYKMISMDLVNRKVTSVYGTPVYIYDSAKNTYINEEQKEKRSAFIVPRDDATIVTNNSIFNMSVGKELLRVRRFPSYVILEPYGLLVDRNQTSIMNYSEFGKTLSDDCEMNPSIRNLNMSQILAAANGVPVPEIKGKEAATQVSRFIRDLEKKSETMKMLRRYVQYCIDEGRLFLDIPALAEFIQEQDGRDFKRVVEEARRSSYNVDFYVSGRVDDKEGDLTSFLVSRALLLQYQGILYSEPSLIDEVKPNSVVEQPNLYYMRIDPLAAAVLWGDSNKERNIKKRKAMFEGVGAIPVKPVPNNYGKILNLKYEDKNLIK